MTLWRFWYSDARNVSKRLLHDQAVAAARGMQDADRSNNRGKCLVFGGDGVARQDSGEDIEFIAEHSV
jgi:hypothetical protein